ncbi:MAG: CHAP domain-containing protein, partial [Ruminococcus sp.]|nr:CHAP domain-containing protein [Ruminococcus sp.]
MIRRKLINKSSAVIFAVAVLFAAVFSMSAYASAATTYTPRTTAPSYSNSYYYSDKNIFYACGYGMPNCTAYAYGRAYELLGSKPNLSKWSAEYWYGDNIEEGAYSYGKTPRLGAIACWRYNGGGGHVAVVEKIENGTITFSNSAWGGSNFYLTHASVNDSTAGGQSWWNFQGYIYILDNAESDQTQGNLLSSASSTGIYKTNVSSSLNMRSGAGTGYGVVTTVSNNVTLTVTSVQASGGYTWGYTTYKGYGGWISLDYCTFISELPADYDANLDTPKIKSSENTEAGIKLSWSAVEGASKYRVFYKSGSGWRALGDTDGTSFVDDDVRSGNSYTYTVRCLSADGSRYTSDYDSNGFKARFIAMPKIKNSENTADGVKLNWDAVTGASKYRVFYLGSRGWNRLGDTEGTSITDTIVRSGATYVYTIRCVGSDGSYTSTFDSDGFSATYIDVPVISKSENT